MFKLQVNRDGGCFARGAWKKADYGKLFCLPCGAISPGDSLMALWWITCSKQKRAKGTLRGRAAQGRDTARSC